MILIGFSSCSRPGARRQHRRTFRCTQRCERSLLCCDRARVGAELTRAIESALRVVQPTEPQERKRTTELRVGKLRPHGNDRVILRERAGSVATQERNRR